MLSMPSPTKLYSRKNSQTELFLIRDLTYHQFTSTKNAKFRNVGNVQYL